MRARGVCGNDDKACPVTSTGRSHTFDSFEHAAHAFTATPMRPGIFNGRRRPHEEMGMAGIVVVKHGGRPPGQREESLTPPGRSRRRG